MERVPTQFKEVVVHTHLLNLQNLLPGFDKQAFYIGLRSSYRVRNCCTSRLRMWQSFTIELSVYCEWKLFQKDKVGGDHRFEKPVPGIFPHVFAGDTVCRRDLEISDQG